VKSRKFLPHTSSLSQLISGIRVILVLDILTYLWWGRQNNYG